MSGNSSRRVSFARPKSRSRHRPPRRRRRGSRPGARCRCTALRSLARRTDAGCRVRARRGPGRIRCRPETSASCPPHLAAQYGEPASLPATFEEAEDAVVAVRAAGRLCLGRVACLEESAAATLLLALSHRRVIWCHGAAADPIRLHAWVETVGHDPVAEPVSTGRFATLRTIPAHQSSRREPSATPPGP
ncbi:lasso peptide biosynthesis B2 protein [Amycolatopsis saalfeldensis]|uniref:lasso peptide biosynthesis B2 protein n=1 Tax=Amycolatopsis saalfeldensis TaxID=394193 RepID=UPI000B841972